MRLLKPEACDDPALCLNHKLLLLAVGLDWSMYRGAAHPGIKKSYRGKTRESIAAFRAHECGEEGGEKPVL